MRRISDFCFGVEGVLELGLRSCSKSVSDTKFSNCEVSRVIVMDQFGGENICSVRTLVKGQSHHT